MLILLPHRSRRHDFFSFRPSPFRGRFLKDDINKRPAAHVVVGDGTAFCVGNMVVYVYFTRAPANWALHDCRWGIRVQMVANYGVHTNCWGVSLVIKRYRCCVNVVERPYTTFFQLHSHFNRYGLKCWDADNSQFQSIQNSITTVLDAERLNMYAITERQYLTVT